MFRDFKRHYHKTSNLLKKGKIIPNWINKSSFSFEKVDDGVRIQSNVMLPDNEETVRFVTLMRRFLNSADSIYYKNIINFIREEYSGIATSEDLLQIEDLAKNLEQGQIPINIDGDDITAENIYYLISEGGYFNTNDEIQAYLQNLSNVPLIGSIFWNQFYDYTLTAYILTSKIFDVIKHIEESDEYKLSQERTSNPIARCIYCLRADGIFEDEEHIFPEALGNDELFLPKGYVCKQCNNNTLSKLDTLLLNFAPISFLQVQFVPFTKGAKFPKAKYQNLHIERTGPRSISFKPQDKSGELKQKEELGDDWYKFDFSVKAKGVNEILLGKSLYKIALGMIALAEGADVAISKKYDAARNYILQQDSSFRNNILMRTHFEPRPESTVIHQTFSEGTLFMISIYGLVFYLNLEETPQIGLNPELAKAGFISFALHED